MQVLPAIDLYQNQVVRLLQGRYDQKHVYHDDPVALSCMFKAHGISTIHVVDLEAAQAQELRHVHILRSIKNKTQLNIHFGGGVRSLEDVRLLFRDVLSLSQDKIMIGSLPFQDAYAFQDIVCQYAENLIITLDVWGYDIRIHGWQKDTHRDVRDYITYLHHQYELNTFLVTQIKRDGMLSGTDIALYQELSTAFPTLHFIASGGVNHIANLYALKKACKIDAVIVGKALYANHISMNDIYQFNQGNNL